MHKSATNKRLAIDPVAPCFGDSFESSIEQATSKGAKSYKMGDSSVTVEEQPEPTTSKRSESESSMSTFSDEDSDDEGEDYSLADSFDETVAGYHEDDGMSYTRK